MPRGEPASSDRDDTRDDRIDRQRSSREEDVLEDDLSYRSSAAYTSTDTPDTHNP
jgi:hypothetical protein